MAARRSAADGLVTDLLIVAGAGLALYALYAWARASVPSPSDIASDAASAEGQFLTSGGPGGWLEEAYDLLTGTPEDPNNDWSNADGA